MWKSCVIDRSATSSIWRILNTRQSATSPRSVRLRSGSATTVANQATSRRRAPSRAPSPPNSATRAEASATSKPSVRPCASKARTKNATYVFTFFLSLSCFLSFFLVRTCTAHGMPPPAKKMLGGMMTGCSFLFFFYCRIVATLGISRGCVPMMRRNTALAAPAVGVVVVAAPADTWRARRRRVAD
jgi:hypothetical protein